MLLNFAKWIWLHGKNTVNTYADFKRRIQLQKDKTTEIEISVDGNYALYLNGHFVDSGQYPDYLQYKVYDRLNLDKWVLDGENELLIRVWWPGVDHFSYRAESPGLLYAVANGEEVVATSDPQTMAAVNSSFQSGDIPTITEQLGFSFKYDARTAGMEEYSSACVVEKEATLYPRPVKKVVVGERMPSKLINHGTFIERSWTRWGEQMQNAALTTEYWGPDSVWNGEHGTEFSTTAGDGKFFIFDLGAECVGYADLELDLPEDALVLCGWGEHLIDLRVRSCVGPRNFVFSYYGKKGHNRFFMPLRRLGLRYLQLHVYAPSVTLYYAGVRSTDYPLEQYPIKIKDQLHRKIYEVSINTLRHCMHDHYEDSPWREQGLYSMDSRNQMLCTYHIFKDTAFPKASLRLMGLSVREDGMIELCSPAKVPITIPSFTAAYLVQLWEYFEYSKDREFILEMLPHAEKIAEKFAENIDSRKGVLHAYEDKKYWNFYEWQQELRGGHGVKDLNELTYDAPLCAFVSMAFQAMEKIYINLNEQEKAAKYRHLWQDLNQKAHELFWNGNCYYTYHNIASGEGFHCAELTQALMICCGACPKEHLVQLRELLKESQDLLPITLSYNIFKYDALLTDPANYPWVLENIKEIWGTMLFNGATTFWETAKGALDFHNAGSLCHGWSAIPIYYYHKYGNV